MYWAGYAHRRLGRELSAGLVLERAKVELESGGDFLQRALRARTSPRFSGRHFNAMCYRAIVLNYDALIEFE